MIELLLIATFGLITGVVLGLFSVFPIYFAGFIVYAFHSAWSPEALLIFWTTAAIGSQFFGSVSTITLGIPGESSSLVYIKHIQNMSLSDRNRLLYHTAKGSLFAGAMALLLVWVAYHWLSSQIHILSSVNFTLAIFLIVVSMFAFTERRPVVSLMLLVIGISLGPNNNYALPAEWYRIQQWFENTSFFLLILGLMIIPDLVFDKLSPGSTDIKHYTAVPQGPKTWWTIIKSTVIGVIAGSVPGPAAETAAAAAYHSHRSKGPFQQIVAAETANNPGVVMMFLPFFVMGLPITASSLIISNVLDIKNIDIVEFSQGSSRYMTGLTIFDSVIIVALLATVFYFLLSTRFIDFYVKLVGKLYGKSRWLLFAIIASMAIIDININEGSPGLYLLLMGFFILVGLFLKYLKTNPILLIFGIMFGDKLVWTILQFYRINFG